MPTDSAARTRVEGGLAGALAVSVTRLARRLRQERGTDLTANQLSVLGTLRRAGPLTPGMLAAAEGVQPPSMTRTVACLVELGMVSRQAHASDRRQVVVQLSEHGEKLLADERRRRDAWLARRLRELDPADREVLRRAAAVLDGLARS
jgi:DNA-binding MarR family transcriptional regulator